MTTIQLDSIRGTELHFRGGRATDKQRAYLCFNPEERHAWCEVSTLDGATPVRVYHRRELRAECGALRAKYATRLLEACEEDLAAVSDGYSERWDGNNRVGSLTEEAEAAWDRVRERCEEAKEETDHHLRVWEAGDWFAGLGTAEQQARALGVTAEMNDSKLESLALDLTGEAESLDECDVLRGCEAHLRWLRTKLADG